MVCVSWPLHLTLDGQPLLPAPCCCCCGGRAQQRGGHSSAFAVLELPGDLLVPALAPRGPFTRNVFSEPFPLFLLLLPSFPWGTVLISAVVQYGVCKLSSLSVLLGRLVPSPKPYHNPHGMGRVGERDTIAIEKIRNKTFTK